MKPPRFVCMSIVLGFAIFVAALAAGQPSPIAQADHSADVTHALRNPQTLSFGATGRRMQAPQIASLNFANPVDYDAGGNAQAVAVADVNGDGKPDLVVGNQLCLNYNEYAVCLEAEGAVQILLGNGDGTFRPGKSYHWGGPPVVSVAIGDLNGDGKPDLVAASSNGGVSAELSVLFGNGDGTFQAPVNYSSGTGLSTASIVIADVNGDGYPDLITAGSGVGVLLNNGNGTFQTAVTYDSNPGSGNSSVAVGDLNGDGYPDLALATNCGECGGSILLNNGDGTFQPAIYFDEGQPISTVAMADLNGDGKLDLVAGVIYSLGVSDVSVLLGNGDGTFQPAVRYDPGGAEPTSIVIADVNGDGHLDLVVGNSAGDGPFAFNSGVIGVLLGNGDGTFQAPIVYSSGGFNTNGQIAVSDLNGDGLADIVAPDSCNAIIPIYAGGNEYLRCEESDSPVGVLLQIPPDAKTSSTSMASSLNPWYYGAPLTLSATVTPTPGGKATGNVKFYDGWVKLGSSSLKDNVASLSGLAPAFGWHLFRAQYSGGDGVPASISAPLEEVSNQATTTTVVVASVNPSYVGQTVTYTAAVTGLYGGAVTGTVTFVQGLGKQAITLCSAVALVNGQAACDATYTAAGGYPITASYSGDPNNVHSTSARLSHDVRVLPAPTTTKVSTSGSPSLVNQDVTFTATVTSNLPIPDGETVTFYRGAIEIGTGTTSNGIAVLTSSFSYAHTYLIEAHYPGDTSHKRSLGSVQQVVSP